ncbi:MAG: sortase [Chloroflexi bacterium]|nr:sortase [Chloroflexota bacterium]
MVVVGKDFPALRAMRTCSKGRWVSLGMITLGVLMLGTVGGYYLYSVIARSQLGALEYTVPLDVTDQSGGFSSIYPGSLVPSLSWDDPRWTDVDYDSNSSLFEGFTPVDGSGLPPEAGRLSAPTRIEIPAIGLGSNVKALEVINYGDARGWETPKDVVGHIPTTNNPGEAGNGYLFGHLQSPIRGEGSVFRNLTRVPDLLRKGQDVYIVLYNEEDTAYLYQIVQTEVVKASDFAIEHTPDATITLVSCVPEYVYDHRLLVTAKLVGVKA